jgi:hypothetical protein
MKRFEYTDDFDEDRMYAPRKKGAGKLKKMRDVEKARDSKKERGRFRKRN